MNSTEMKKGIEIIKALDELEAEVSRLAADLCKRFPEIPKTVEEKAEAFEVVTQLLLLRELSVKGYRIILETLCMSIVAVPPTPTVNLGVNVSNN